MFLMWRGCDFDQDDRDDDDDLLSGSFTHLGGGLDEGRLMENPVFTLLGKTQYSKKIDTFRVILNVRILLSSISNSVNL